MVVLFGVGFVYVGLVGFVLARSVDGLGLIVVGFSVASGWVWLFARVELPEFGVFWVAVAYARKVGGPL